MVVRGSRGSGTFGVSTAEPRNDAYTVMLGISLAAMLFGCLLLFLDYNGYPAKKPEAPPAPSQRPAVANPAPPAPAPAGQPAVPQGVPAK